MAVFKKMSPGRFIVLGFAAVIILGAILLVLPFTSNDGVNISFIDALFTSTSAVCVTGLSTVDTRDTYNVLGRIVVALLIQVGGLGFASFGVGFFLLARKKVSFKDRLVVKEALNLGSIKGIVKLVKSIFLITLCFESIGVILSFIVFSKDYPPLTALGISMFHAVSAFNNAGFDVLGGFKGLVGYVDNVLLNLTTCGLIIFGGLGFFVIKEIIHKHSFKKFSLHTKIVLTMTISLLITGTLIIKLTEDVSWLGAFFFSTSARTAGFATYAVGSFTNAGLFVIIILMFIGASPGSTGGGIKTTTAFTLFRSAYSVATNKHCCAFKRRISHDVVTKAFIIAFLALTLVCIDTFLMSIIEPDYTFIQILFEVVSAFGTVGLSTGITPELSSLSKLILILTMFVGRLGPLTIATIWSFKAMSNVTYSEETLTIG
ncbi:H(+)-transporting ATPase [Anaerocolumna sedimenticola]|uniref:H(+)-transporting ATPase n=1 Tax=Anaerocolumna sedimenticola TaxID=2696063 RepID=A0A6P1TKV7_9FIRM|nr:potassium transporter TrkG [Anaerocolumna sedimenticola]QHQ60779.1 H(+)-transporting ATPase [Anaerocolumna sedimenticola]